MWTSNKNRRLIAWIATFAILLSALAPSISHAVALAKGEKSLWVEVCSVAGSKLVKVGDAGDPATPAKKPAGMEHCPFCSTHAGSAGILPGAGIVLPAALGKPVVPTLYYQSPRPLFSWAPAQSRAPPALS